MSVARDNGWCRHRTPFGEDHPTCEAGLDYRKLFMLDAAGKVIPGYLDRMPCLGRMAGVGRCASYSAWTKEEIEAKEKEALGRLMRMVTIKDAILEITGPKDTGVGVINPCPACEKGKVSWSRARNGHIHARCSTPMCASWME